MQNSSTITKIKTFILDTIFPFTCLHCNNILAQNNSINTYTGLCITCIPLIQISESSDKIGQYLDKVIYATTYKNPIVKNLVKTLKYRFVRTIGSDMTNYIIKRISKLKTWSIPHDTIITSVPLHIRRLRWRGFNHAQNIAIHLAHSLELPYQDILTKKNKTKPQADIKHRYERLGNIGQSIDLLPNTKLSQHVIVVDDLVTTGATLDACAKILKKYGVKTVIGITFARG